MAGLGERLGAAASGEARNAVVQALLAISLLVPLAATAGEFWDSGFFRQTVNVDLLFWPAAKWHWGVPMNVAGVMCVFGVAYAAGIVWLLRRRTLLPMLATGIGGLIVAQLLAAAVNHFTGYREMQGLSSMEFAGKLDRLILAQWHDPIWEELVFRGLPLACLFLAVRRWPARRRLATWCYFIIPAVALAAYHVPRHGYARIPDTLVLSVVFAWIALRYGFPAVVVLHCILDAVSVLSLSKHHNFGAEEVQWLAANFHLLNSTFTVAFLGGVSLWAMAAVFRFWRTPMAVIAGSTASGE